MSINLFLMRLVLFYQNDLLQLFQPFGVITKLVMLRAKNQVFCFSICIISVTHGRSRGFMFYMSSHVKSPVQALIQMQDTPAAVSALQFYGNVQPAIRYKYVPFVFFLSPF